MECVSVEVSGAYRVRSAEDCNSGAGVDPVEVWAFDEPCVGRFVGLVGALARRERRAASSSCMSETDSLVVSLKVSVR